MEWRQWRGAHRDGIVERLPTSLPQTDGVLWHHELLNEGLGGIAVADGKVLFGDRDADDFQDVWRCLDLKTGQELWTVNELAIGQLDYGNSPRATPLVHGEFVYLQGALGHLICVRLKNGERVWMRNLADEFGLLPDGDFGEKLPWGYCGSPLIVDGRLIVQPGGPKASLVGLSPATGETIWKTAGHPPSYGSVIAAELGGKLQIVGHDKTTIGGWDPKTGQRLWTVEPAATGDFNVPTPIVIDGKLFIVTENNGARLFQFESDGRIDPKPVAINRKLTPNMSTPVVVGDLLFCVDRFLYCLNLKEGLKEEWRIRDDALGDYAAIVGSASHLLVAGEGEMLLLSADGSKEILSRRRLFKEKQPLFCHPVVIGERLIIRGPSGVKCVSLSDGK